MIKSTLKMLTAIITLDQTLILFYSGVMISLTCTQRNLCFDEIFNIPLLDNCQTKIPTTS